MADDQDVRAVSDERLSESELAQAGGDGIHRTVIDPGILGFWAYGRTRSIGQISTDMWGGPSATGAKSGAEPPAVGGDFAVFSRSGAGANFGANLALAFLP
jgi:hypothetical protein